MSTNRNNKKADLTNYMIKLAVLVIIGILGAIGLNFTLPKDESTKPSSQTTITNSITNADEIVWDESTAPNYVAITGKADFEPITLQTKEGSYQIYSDDLNRPNLVVANVNYDMAKKGSDRERNDLPNPLGWPKNKEVDIQMCDGTYHGWLFNRSHLLAKSLGGPDTKDNLVTGTRCQNVGSNDGTGGMGMPETLSRDWLKEHKDGSLYYEVEPNYVNDEKIPRSVSVDVKTSDGQIDSHFVTYNYAKGYEIDYATGDWHAV